MHAGPPNAKVAFNLHLSVFEDKKIRLFLAFDQIVTSPPSPSTLHVLVWLHAPDKSSGTRNPCTEPPASKHSRTNVL